MAHKYFYADQNTQHEGQVDIHFYVLQETELKRTEIGKTEQTGIFFQIYCICIRALDDTDKLETCSDNFS